MSRKFYGFVFGLALWVAIPDAQALELSRHIGAGDTYVTAYAPRLDQAGGGAGFYVERHYNFGLSRLAERFYGEGSIQVTITPFSDFDRPDGSNYIRDKVMSEACETAEAHQENERDAKVFLGQFCKSFPEADR